MARFQRFIPLLVVIFMVLLAGTGLFISEARIVRAATASAASEVNASPADANNYAGVLSTLVDMPGFPY
jgi:hypothetical protein